MRDGVEAGIVMFIQTWRPLHTVGAADDPVASGLTVFWKWIMGILKSHDLEKVPLANIEASWGGSLAALLLCLRFPSNKLLLSCYIAKFFFFCFVALFLPFFFSMQHDINQMYIFFPIILLSFSYLFICFYCLFTVFLIIFTARVARCEVSAPRSSAVHSFCFEQNRWKCLSLKPKCLRRRGAASRHKKKNERKQRRPRRVIESEERGGGKRGGTPSCKTQMEKDVATGKLTRLFGHSRRSCCRIWERRGNRADRRPQHFLAIGHSGVCVCASVRPPPSLFGKVWPFCDETLNWVLSVRPWLRRLLRRSGRPTLFTSHLDGVQTSSAACADGLQSRLDPDFRGKYHQNTE